MRVDLPQQPGSRLRPPLDRLAVKEISARYLSQDERIEMADLRRAGLSVRQIARRIGLAPSTISRELRRNGRQRSSAPILAEGNEPERVLPEHLQAVEDEINNRPRFILEDHTPAGLFAALLVPRLERLML